MNQKIKGLFLLLIITGQSICSSAQETATGGKAEEFEFQAEVGRLMDIIINSLYSNKEIFLREMISNASDALDKIRFLSIKNPDMLADQPNLEISIEFDSEKKTISITDTGIGMTKNDLIQNLGTIAKSGTTQFIEAIKGGNVNIIGQFGVGFYSTFLVGQKVEVVSKHPTEDQYIWESSAASSFKIFKDPAGNTLKRGTKVVVYLKQDAYEYTEEKTITDLIKKYSEFINFPIKLRVFKEVSKEVPIEDEVEVKPEEKKEGETEKKDEEKKDEEKKEEEKKDDLEVKEGEEKKEEPKKKTKTVKETVTEYKVLNDNKAIWTRSKEQIEDEEYKKFYKALTKDYDDPLTWINFKAEGEVEFTSLLFCPKRAPHDLFENYYGKSAALKLYVRRVLINEEFEELMPRYLNFIRGLVDSDDLPINVSRDSIQQLKMLKVMSKKLVRKALEMIRKMAEVDAVEEEDEDDDEGTDTKKEGEDKITKEEDEKESAEELEKKKKEKINRFNDFWKEFGKNIKLGIIEDSANRVKLAKLSRWYSSKNSTELTSFDQYISRGKTGQDNIYFLAGENRELLMSHPTLQKLLKKGYEVLLLDDPIDEFTFQHLTEYENKKFSNVGKGDFKFPEDDDIERKKLKKLKKVFKTLTEWWKNLLSVDIENVIVSQRLVDDPCVIVSSEQGYSANMERISKAQAYSHTDKQNPYSNTKKILEINPSHPAIKELLERVKDDPDKETEELARVLFEGALVNSGFQLREPQVFAKRFYKLFNGALGIPRDAPIQEMEVDLTEVDEDEDDKDKKPGQPGTPPPNTEAPPQAEPASDDKKEAKKTEL